MSDKPNPLGTIRDVQTAYESHEIHEKILNEGKLVNRFSTGLGGALKWIRFAFSHWKAKPEAQKTLEDDKFFKRMGETLEVFSRTHPQVAPKATGKPKDGLKKTLKGLKQQDSESYTKIKTATANFIKIATEKRISPEGSAALQTAQRLQKAIDSAEKVKAEKVKTEEPKPTQPKVKKSKKSKSKKGTEEAPKTAPVVSQSAPSTAKPSKTGGEVAPQKSVIATPPKKPPEVKPSVAKKVDLTPPPSPSKASTTTSSSLSFPLSDLERAQAKKMLERLKTRFGEGLPFSPTEIWKEFPELKTFTERDKEVQGQFNLITNQALVRRQLAKPEFFNVTPTEQHVLDLFGASLNGRQAEGAKSSTTRDLSNLLKDPLPAYQMKKLSETHPKDMVATLRSVRFSHQLSQMQNSDGKPFSDVQQANIKTLASNLQEKVDLAAAEQEKELSKMGMDSKTFKELLMKHFLTSNAIALKGMCGRPESEFGAHMKALFDKRLPEAVRELSQNISSSQKRMDAINAWKQANASALRFEVSQGEADSNAVLTDGVCFMHGLRLQSYLVRNPSATAEEIRSFLLEDRANKPNVSSSDFFSSADRAAQAKYLIASSAKDIRAVNAPPSSLKKYGLREETPVMIRTEGRKNAQNAAMQGIEKTITDNSNHSFIFCMSDGKETGHAIALQIDPNTKQFRFYDPNLGLYEFNSYDEFKKSFISYLSAVYPEMSRFSLNAYSPLSS